MTFGNPYALIGLLIVPILIALKKKAKRDDAAIGFSPQASSTRPPPGKYGSARPSCASITLCHRS